MQAVNCMQKNITMYSGYHSRFSQHVPSQSVSYYEGTLERKGIPGPRPRKSTGLSR